MAFNWPGKKEVREPGAKPEFPAALEADIAELPGQQGREPAAVGCPRGSHRARPPATATPWPR